MNNEIIKVNYETEHPTVSARELHKGLEVKTAFKDWFPRMCEYGFEEGKDFCSILSESTGGRPSKEYQITVDMAKQICMIQRSDKGTMYRKYFLELEKAWNTPEQVMARALQIADKQIDKLKNQNTLLLEDVERMKPKEIFADAVSASENSILVRELAKMIKQNGVEIGEKRLYKWLRDNGYICQGSTEPTQRAMELGLFERIVRTISIGDKPPIERLTTKVTGKGQQYFINKLIVASI